MLDPVDFEAFLKAWAARWPRSCASTGQAGAGNPAGVGRRPGVRRLGDVLSWPSRASSPPTADGRRACPARQVTLRQLSEGDAHLRRRGGSSGPRPACCSISAKGACRDAGHGRGGSAPVQPATGHRPSGLLRRRLRTGDAPLAVMISAAARDALRRLAGGAKAAQGRADNTLDAYARDVAGFPGLHDRPSRAGAGAWAPLSGWICRTCAAGWRLPRAAGCRPVAGAQALGGQELLSLAVRARGVRRHRRPVRPGAEIPRKLPRPLAEEDARDVIDTLRRGCNRPPLGRRARSGGRHAALRLRPADIRGAAADRVPTSCPWPRRCASSARAARNASCRSSRPRARRSAPTRTSAR